MTENFTLEELTRSQVALRHGLDNTPDATVAANLYRLAVTLEQVRKLVGLPIVVSSAYRSKEVNRAVGGSPNSAHMRGLAADITCPTVTNRMLAIMIRDSDIAFDQLIFEGNWVHIGLSEGAPRRQVLTATFINGKANYSEGIK